ncbi:MAG: MarR family transcriptional regulator [Actinomycetales bacterium]|nr:MarR family transcriptional regulator [Actinomycetales bacterium]
MPGSHTLSETEHAVSERLGGMPVDAAAMAACSNLFRAANAVRNHLERSALAPHDLSWTAFVVLWVVWIWEPIETRDIAAEAGFSKATLTGVLDTLEGRGLLTRSRSASDGRLVEVSLTARGRRLMTRLFPAFNATEADLVGAMGKRRLAEMTEGLRAMVRATETD